MNKKQAPEEIILSAVTVVASRSFEMRSDDRTEMTELVVGALIAERERCARIVERGLGRTNTAIARAIREGEPCDTPPPSTHLRVLQKLPTAFEVLDTESGTYLTRSEDRARNSGFEYNGLYRRDSAELKVTPHPDDLAVDRFAAAMKAKLAKKREEGRGGWDDPEQCHIDYLHQLLDEQFHDRAVIDPVDIANLAMMIHERTPVNG